MAGPIRSLDDLARKGFDLNVQCPSCGYDRTILIAEAMRLFRERGYRSSTIWGYVPRGRKRLRSKYVVDGDTLMPAATT